MKIVLRILYVSLFLGAIWYLFFSSRLDSNLRLREPVMAATESYAGDIEAPEFPSGLDWINTEGDELTLESLQGKIVLLDFWTYGCINCIHIIPDLKRLEAKYPNSLVVIGVHSAKFENEGDTEQIRKIVQRYRLEHPVVNDKDFVIWKNYSARAWPTLALIDPAGNVVGSVAGEGHYDLLDKIIGALKKEFTASGKLDTEPLSYQTEVALIPDMPLEFPGKVLADAKNKRLFIADTNHNRIVVTDLEGKLQTIIGGKASGFVDGDFATARFSQPHGMTLSDHDTLYVADTENHAIRRVDLKNREVTTIAGNGKQVYLRNDKVDPQVSGLNSPWDVLFHKGQLYIAMAGQHQIWRFDTTDNSLQAFAGSRREALLDGNLLAAGLNQPSGLATDGKHLFIADSEASAIRQADLTPDGKLSTIVGKGLFDFGDKDGVDNDVLLQHPLGVQIYQEDGELRLLIADTYNSKIKIVDPAARSSFTLAGGNGKLDEPGGISLAGNRLYIADTNNHRVRVLDLETKLFRTLSVDGLE